MQSGQEPDEQVEIGLILAETLINAEIERKNWRAPTNMILQHLIVGGNAMEMVTPDNRIRGFRLDQYVVVRDPSGRLLEFVIEEKVFPDNLPPELGITHSKSKDGDTVPLYTWGRFDSKKNRWEIHQELDESVITKTKGHYLVSPYSALRWSPMIGEDYGRGKVEEHYPDLRALEGLTQSLIEGAAMASRHVNMVRPNAAGGLNLRRRLAKAENGDYVVGNPEDVAMLQFQNTSGQHIVGQEVQRISQDLATAFLMKAGAQRDAERVTATELRMMTEEIEGSLGGVFSMLSQTMQRTRLNRLIAQMQSNEQLPSWEIGVVEPTILTGLEALGREQDVARVGQALQMLQGFDEDTRDYVKMEELLGKMFNGLQLSDAVRTEGEVMERRQQRQAQESEAGIMATGGQAAAQGIGEAAAAQVAQALGEQSQQ